MAREYVVLVAGPMGAGKTTAIVSLSEIPVVSTDAVNTDLARNAKATTTVAMDYGEISLGDGDKVRLYGVPGQERFDFMWRILEKRALGLLLLLDGAAGEPLEDLGYYLQAFQSLAQRGAVAIGVTRRDLSAEPPMAAYNARLAQLGHLLPVFAVDARNAAQMYTMLGALVAMVEARTQAAAVAGAGA